MTRDDWLIANDMGNFAWLLPPTKGFPETYLLEDFLSRSELPEDADWERLANDWGRAQVPPIKFGRVPTSSIEVVSVLR
jgi:hypothetical protein